MACMSSSYIECCIWLVSLLLRIRQACERITDILPGPGMLGFHDERLWTQMHGGILIGNNPYALVFFVAFRASYLCVIGCIMLEVT